MIQTFIDTLKYTLPIILFALFDFFGYNISAKKGWVNDKLISPYRIVQTTVQILIIAGLWYFIDGLTAIVFTLLWWTWCADFLFYIFTFSGIYGNTLALFTEVFGSQVTWAWWTPFGLLHLAVKGKKDGKYRVLGAVTLIIQACLGVSVCIILIKDLLK